MDTHQPPSWVNTRLHTNVGVHIRNTHGLRIRPHDWLIQIRQRKRRTVEFNFTLLRLDGLPEGDVQYDNTAYLKNEEKAGDGQRMPMAGDRSGMWACTTPYRFLNILRRRLRPGVVYINALTNTTMTDCIRETKTVIVPDVTGIY